LNVFWKKSGLLFMIGLLSLCLFSVNCTSDGSLDKRLDAATKPYKFNLINWEYHAIKTLISRDRDSHNDVDEVNDYFSMMGEIRRLESEIAAVKAGNRQGDLASLEAEIARRQQQTSSLQIAVETTLEKQIQEVLAEQGIFNPFYKYIKLRFHFPTPSFLLDEPPHLLVVSPRDRIESMREVLLQQDLSVEEMEAIEAAVDNSVVSSLVVELGGFATLPSFVTNKGDLRFTLNAVGEEWVHKYLAFRPLGFKYLLDLTGISRNYDIATMNETVASMVAKEVGEIVYQRYYNQVNSQPETAPSGFDFNREMRETRRAVDEYLARGEIEAAEEFMEQKRHYLAGHGYHLRKLNQAYFAFHGAYADSPTSISPIGAELKQLRSQSDSLKDFLETAASMTSRKDLAEKVK